MLAFRPDTCARRAHFDLFDLACRRIARAEAAALLDQIFEPEALT